MGSTNEQEKCKSKPTNSFQLTPVQSTSLLVAYWRDLETRQRSRPPLIHDSTARVLLDAMLSPSQRQDYETSPIRPYGWECLAVRTRAMDDWLMTKGDSKSIGGQQQQQQRQLVNLGAGMCCRPYRMEGLPHRLWLEVDSDLELLRLKRSALEAAGYQPNMELKDVAVNLGSNTSLADQLNSNGFSSSVPTDWIAEGLFAYLRHKQHAQILQETATMSHGGSRMTLTIVEPAMREWWGSLGVTLPYADLVPVEQIIEKAKSFGWTLDELIRPGDWSLLYPGRGDIYLAGFNVLFLVKE